MQGRMLQRPAESDPAVAEAREAIDIVAAIADVRDFIDPLLEEAVDGLVGAPERLREAIRYALLAPGKRLRPALTIWASDACGGDRQRAAAGALAVEMIHAYSLVHDDLPAMDDDDLRRGRPTCHRAFDEATAILCGDALQPLAFETLVRHFPCEMAGQACGILAAAAGAEALVGGQAEDLAAEQSANDLSDSGKTADSAAEPLARLERIHRCKTGALFLACLRLGGLAAQASPDQLQALEAYGAAFGLAFQIADDLLDAEGTEESVGKRVGKDAERGKLTFPSLVGIDASRARAHALAAEAEQACRVFGPRGDMLAALADWIVHRNH